MGGGSWFGFGGRGADDASKHFPSSWLEQVEKSTADELTERGLKLSLWARLRRWIAKLRS
jgi:hypothetical protein